MCGRFALTAPASAISEVFQVDVLPDLLPRYNVAPTQQVPCVLEEDGQRQMRNLRWGLIPSWAKDKKIAYKTINARAETVAGKPAYRSAFKRRRCLVVADGFYEWKREGKTKIPHLVQLREGRPFGMAGLWERWVDPESGDEVFSVSIVTTGPNELMVPIHDRMPVILPEGSHALWLDEKVSDKERLQELLVPYPADGMQERTVSSAVNNVRNQGPQCQAAWEGA